MLFHGAYSAETSVYHDVFGCRVGAALDEAPPEEMADRGEENDRWHQGVGLGLRVALNDTFLVALDAAVPVDPDMDGPGVKLYIGLDWLF